MLSLRYHKCKITCSSLVGKFTKFGVFPCSFLAPPLKYELAFHMQKYTILSVW